MTIFSIPAHTHDKGSQNITGYFYRGQNIGLLGNDFGFRNDSLLSSSGSFRTIDYTTGWHDMMKLSAVYVSDSSSVLTLFKTIFNANNEGAWTGVIYSKKVLIVQYINV